MQSIKVKKELARPFLEAPEEILSHSLPVFSLQTALSFHFYPPFIPSPVLSFFPWPQSLPFPWRSCKEFQLEGPPIPHQTYFNEKRAEKGCEEAGDEVQKQQSDNRKLEKENFHS